MGDQKVRVGMTLGDINGIGPEIVIKTFSDVRMVDMCIPVIYGSAKVLAYYKKTVQGAENFQFTLIQSAKDAKPKRINLVDCMGDDVVVEAGISSKTAGKAAVAALEAAAKDIKNGLIDVVVTAPINKENVQGEGFGFKGYTEFFADRFGGEPLMMMCSEMLKVGLVTIHIPVSEIAGSITQEKIVATLGRLRKSLIEDFGVVGPKIAVLSLNPHAGDGGLLGTEEEQIIKPAMAEADKAGILVFGPFAADGFFASMGYRNYDAVLAMFHDQGLAPFKTLTPEGVNFTAGLPVIRTSPDHGVAYDIAGQDIADPASIRGAIFMAMDIRHNRKLYAEMTKNPLQHFERERAGKDLSVKDLIPETDPAD